MGLRGREEGYYSCSLRGLLRLINGLPGEPNSVVAMFVAACMYNKRSLSYSDARGRVASHVCTSVVLSVTVARVPRGIDSSSSTLVFSHTSDLAGDSSRVSQLFSTLPSFLLTEPYFRTSRFQFLTDFNHSRLQFYR